MFTLSSSDVTVTSQRHAAAMLAACAWRLGDKSAVASSPYSQRGDECLLSMRRAAAAAAGSVTPSYDVTTHMSVTSSSSNAAVTSSSGVRPKSLGRESTTTLKAWLLEHIRNPYPSKGEKIMLAVMTRMTLTQVSTWFANARRRLKKEYRVRWLDDEDCVDDDDDVNDDGPDDFDERDCDDVELQRSTTHLNTSEDVSVYSEQQDLIATVGDHDSRLPSSATAAVDDRRSHASDDQPVNMTCRRRSDHTDHTRLTTDVITPTLQHRRSASVAAHAVESPRIWSVVELIQSNKDNNIEPQSTELL